MHLVDDDDSILDADGFFVVLAVQERGVDQEWQTVMSCGAMAACI